MANLRLYRDIYRLNTSPVTGETYTLFNPPTISASSFLRNSNTAIESLTVTNESTGIYYVELNPTYYTFDDIYEVRWVVTYVVSISSKTLKTRFRMRPVNFTGGVFAEVMDNEIIIEIGNAV